MKVLSLFSGVGLGDLGLMMAGMEIVGQVEIDGYCQKILKLRWPDVPKWEDIKNVRPEELPTADLISGGFPCQDISCANTSKREGINGSRSGLWKEYFRIIRSVRPKYVLMENSANLLSEGLGTVLGDLASIGYDAQWDCFGSDIFGAPHRRRRIWVLAYPNGNGYIHSLSYGRFKEAKRREKGFWSKYWNEVRSGFTGNEPIQSMEETKREATNKPWLCRISNGSPTELDRLKALGNGQVVYTVYEIGRLIMEFNKLESKFLT